MVIPMNEKKSQLNDKEVTELAERASFRINVSEFDTEEFIESIETDSLNKMQKNALSGFIEDVCYAVSVTMTIDGKDFPVVVKTPFGTFYSAITSVGEDSSEPVSKELYMAIAQMVIEDENGQFGSWSNSTSDVYNSLNKYEKDVFQAMRISLVEMHLDFPQLVFLERARRIETGVEVMNRL